MKCHSAWQALAAVASSVNGVAFITTGRDRSTIRFSTRPSLETCVCARAQEVCGIYLNRVLNNVFLLLLLLLLYGTTTVVSNAQCRTVSIPFETERTIVHAFECVFACFLCVVYVLLLVKGERERGLLLTPSNLRLKCARWGGKQRWKTFTTEALRQRANRVRLYGVFACYIVHSPKPKHGQLPCTGY